MTPVKQRERVSETDISVAKLALDAARKLGDALRIDLAESTLNDLLDRYHRYHTNQEDQ